MPTPYIDSIFLRRIAGNSLVDTATSDTGAELQAVLDAVNAEVDAYVSCQVALPPHASAIEQVRMAAARLAIACLYGQVAPDSVMEAEKAARKFLQQVASGAVKLYTPEPDPAEPSDGAACGSAPRLSGTPSNWWI